MVVTPIHPLKQFVVVCSDTVTVGPLLHPSSAMLEAASHVKRGVTVAIYVGGKKFEYAEFTANVAGLMDLRKKLEAALGDVQ